MHTFKRTQFITAALIVFTFVCMTALTGPSAAAETGKTDIGKPAPNDFQRLEGKWVRPDGGYVLELRNIKKDGSITAGYFNPRPIRVFRAEASRKDETLSVFVELRDVNYPGSTYKLQYDPVSDRLKGTYFQAVERQTFNIEFVRGR